MPDLLSRVLRSVRDLSDLQQTDVRCQNPECEECLIYLASVMPAEFPCVCHACNTRRKFRPVP